MKSITSLHEDRMVYLETNCESIILDMDTQEAYAELIRYYDEINIRRRNSAGGSWIVWARRHMSYATARL